MKNNTIFVGAALAAMGMPRLIAAKTAPTVSR